MPPWHRLPRNRTAREEVRHRDTRPSHALADYANEYAHPAYGRVRIFCDGDALSWHGLGLDLPLIHRHYDLFDMAPEPTAWFENKTVQFATGVEGHIESLSVPLEPAVAPIVFRRLPEPEMATRASLEPLTGVYRYGTIVFDIGIDEAGRLTFRRNEAGIERLLAHGSIFGFADTEFIRIEFHRNVRTRWTGCCSTNLPAPIWPSATPHRGELGRACRQLGSFRPLLLANPDRGEYR